MASRKTSAILFDIDGTLVDHDGAVVLALTSFHAVHGGELGMSLPELVRRWNELLEIHYTRYLAGAIFLEEQRRARVRELFAASRGDLSQEKADRLFEQYHVQYCASWRAFEDVVPALSALEGVTLGVLSNGDGDQQKKKLSHCGLSNHFGRVFVSSEIGCAKPAAEAFHCACHGMGVAAEECVYVGDRLDTDARASLEAGLTSVWLDRAGTGIEPGAGIQVIHSMMELPDLIGTS